MEVRVVGTNSEYEVGQGITDVSQPPFSGQVLSSVNFLFHELGMGAGHGEPAQQ